MLSCIRLGPKKRSQDVSTALISADQLFKEIVRSITFENGKEFVCHEHIADKLKS